MDSRSTSNFCSQCGGALDRGDAFCSRCGSAVGKTGGDRARFRRRVEDRTVEGWEVKHDYGDRVVMIRRDVGSLGTHALLFFLTGGIGNAIYAWYRYSPGAERIELRADGTDRSLTDEGDDSGWNATDAVSFAVALVLGCFAAFVGVGILLTNSSLPLVAVALLFLVLAAISVANAPRHAPHFESPTTFGRVRSTDEEAVTAPDVPCTACSRPVRNGVKRTFAERRYVAGIPVRTLNEGANHYCRACANGDPFAESVERKGWEAEREFA